MATQPPPPGNGRESLSFSLGGKSVAIQSGNLVTILLLLGLLVSVGAIFVALDRRITTLVEGQSRLATMQEANRGIIIDALHEQRTFVMEQARQGQQRQERQAELMQRLLLVLDLPPEIIGGSKRFAPEMAPAPPEKPSR